MIDREKLVKIIDARDRLEGIVNVEITVYPSGGYRVWVTPLEWGNVLTEDKRHMVLGVLTPLTGKLEKKLDGTDIDYHGELGNVSVYINRADQCKVVGYKIVTKRVAKKEVKKVVQEEEVETGEYEDEEIRVPITDCEIRTGKASESDIQVPA